MSFSDAFSTLMKVRRVVVIISILAGAGYKAAPMVWHKAEGKPEVKTQAKAIIPSPVIQSGTTTNAAGIKLSNCDLGEIFLTNHFETCISLGKGQDCLLTPSVIDKNNLQITVTVKSKNANGRIHGLCMTQVVAKPGKPFEVAVGDVSFSLTPNVASE